MGIVSLRPKRLNAKKIYKLFPQLKKLDLRQVGDLSLTGLDVLSKLKHLTSVKLPLMSDLWLSKFYRLTQLQNLNLSSASLITDEGLKGICQGLKGLKSLNLKRCNRLTNNGIRSVSALVELTYLNLSALTFLTHEGLKPLRRLSGLVILKMNDCPLVDDEAMEDVCKLHTLTDLHMTNHASSSSPLTNVSLMVTQLRTCEV